MIMKDPHHIRCFSFVIMPGDGAVLLVALYHGILPL
jgi:hypothetical protein